MVQNIMASTSSPISFAFVYPLTSWSRITHASTIIIVVLVRESCLLFLDVVWMQSDSYLYCYSPYYRHDIEAIDTFDGGLVFRWLWYGKVDYLFYEPLLYYSSALVYNWITLYHTIIVFTLFAPYASSTTWSTRDHISVTVCLSSYPYLNPLLHWLTAMVY